MPIVEKSSYKTPFLLGNAHIQTIVPSYIRPKEDITYEREPMDTPDGDVIHLDWSRTGSDKLLVINHGLCGHTKRHYVLSLVKAFNEIGWDCLAWNYRGTSAEPNKLLKFTTNDSTDDLSWVVNYAIEHGGYSSVALSGYSMGGNLVALYLAREADSLPEEVVGGAVFCATLDLKACSLALDSTFTRFYEEHFLHKLFDMMIEKNAQFPDQVDLDLLPGIKSFKDFDNAFTAPLCGFKDAEDYWLIASASNYLEKLDRPLLIVNPKNDPFLAGDCFPLEFAQNSEYLYLEMPDSGGHCGFITPNIGKEWWPAYRAKEFIQPLAK